MERHTVIHCREIALCISLVDTMVSGIDGGGTMPWPPCPCILSELKSAFVGFDLSQVELTVSQQ